MVISLDPVSLGTCRRLLISVVLMALWARLLSPQSLGMGLALFASIGAVVVALGAAFRREPLFGSSLNRWDEAVALIGVQCLAIFWI